MTEEKKLELRVRALEAQNEAQSELLAIALNALMIGDLGTVQQTLLDAARYSGPSVAKKAIADIAKRALMVS